MGFYILTGILHAFFFFFLTSHQFTSFDSASYLKISAVPDALCTQKHCEHLSGSFDYFCLLLRFCEDCGRF